MVLSYTTDSCNCLFHFTFGDASGLYCAKAYSFYKLSQMDSYLFLMQTINFLKILICDCEIDLPKMSVMCQIILARLHLVLSKAVERFHSVM